MRVKLNYLFAIILLFLLNACSEKKITGGSDHPNEIEGHVYAETKAVPLARVQLYRYSQDSLSDLDNFYTTPVETLWQVTDSLGYYNFNNVSAGTYQLEAFASKAKKIALSEFFKMNEDSSSRAKNLSLDSAHQIFGQLDSSQTDWLEKGIIALKSTPYQSKIDSVGHFYFPQVPSGNYELILVDSQTKILAFSTDSLKNDSLRIPPKNKLDPPPLLPPIDPKLPLYSKATKVFSLEDHAKTYRVNVGDTLFLHLMNKEKDPYVWKHQNTPNESEIQWKKGQAPLVYRESKLLQNYVFDEWFFCIPEEKGIAEVHFNLIEDQNSLHSQQAFYFILKVD